MRLLVAILVIGLSPAAFASPSDEDSAAYERFAIAVNEPIFWTQKSIGVSLYAALHRHHAIRANVANYLTTGSQLNGAVARAAGGTPIDRGGYFDIGLGWQWYPQKLWDGPTVELGLVWRSDKTKYPDFFETSPAAEIDRDARGILARGLVGWSWLFYDRLIIMTAVGGAVGYERGTELVVLDDYMTRFTRPSPSVVATLEWYLRFGWNF